MFKGVVLLLLAAITFVAATINLKIAISTIDNIPAIQVVFIRFLVGFVIFSTYFIVKKQKPVSKKPKILFLRSILNTIAVVLFFTGIKFTTLTNANMMNLTYPAFIFLMSPFINKEKSKLHHTFFLMTTLLGVYLILTPNGSSFLTNINMGDILCLASGFVAAMALCYLRESRKHDTVPVVIFYVTGIGLFITGLSGYRFFNFTNSEVLFTSMTSAILAFSGQAFLTIGYRYINAALGSIVLASGIIFGTLGGIIFFNEQLALSIILGGALIFGSVVGVSGIFEKDFHLIPRIRVFMGRLFPVERRGDSY